MTGGGNGIGRELLLGLLSRGTSVAAVDVSETALNDTVKLAGTEMNPTTHIANVTDRGAVAALPGQVKSVHRTVDGIINNAGIIQPSVKLVDLDYEAIERVVNVSFHGTLYMTEAFLPHLLERPEAHITNISSGGAASARTNLLWSFQGCCKTPD